MNTKLVIRPTTYMTPVRLEDTRKKLIQLASLFTDTPLPNQFLPFLVPLGDVLMPEPENMRLARVMKHRIVIERNFVRFETETKDLEDDSLTHVQFPSFPQCGVFTEKCKLPIQQGPGAGQLFFLLSDIVDQFYSDGSHSPSRRLRGWIQRIEDSNPHTLTIELTSTGLEAKLSTGKTATLTFTTA